MLKKTVTLLLAGSIVFGEMTQSGMIQANADENGARTHLLPVLTQDEQIEKNEEPESKLSYMLRNELKQNKDKKAVFDVKVRVHFDYTDEEFEQKI